ncbi:MAG: ABC transporter substrate-binding protein [Pseudoclavibacter sp.]
MTTTPRALGANGTTRFFSGTAAATAALLALTACASGDAPAGPGGDGGGDVAGAIDAESAQISPEAAAHMNELYAAAVENGETEINVISGLPDDMQPVFDAFEAQFPEISISVTSLIGAPLIAQLESERESGQRTTDVLHNPNGHLYTDFAEAYEVQSITVPDALAGSADELVDPDGYTSSPFVGFFGLGIFTPRAQESGLDPNNWSDFAAPEYAGLVGTGDPTLPGPSQDAPVYLSLNESMTEDDVEGFAENAVVKGTYGDAVAGLMQGEYPFMFAAPVSAIILAADQGAPVEFQLMDEGNYVVTHKQLLLDEAPNPNAAKLYLEFLNTFAAQEAAASRGFTPLNEAASAETVADMPWTSLTESGLTEIVPASTIDDERPELVEWFGTIF